MLSYPPAFWLTFRCVYAHLHINSGVVLYVLLFHCIIAFNFFYSLFHFKKLISSVIVVIVVKPFNLRSTQNLSVQWVLTVGAVLYSRPLALNSSWVINLLDSNCPLCPLPLVPGNHHSSLCLCEFNYLKILHVSGIMWYTFFYDWLISLYVNQFPWIT